MEMPESLVEEELDRQMNNFAYQLQRSGMSMEQYAKMMGEIWAPCARPSVPPLRSRPRWM